jgi:hypothetical protein
LFQSEFPLYRKIKIPIWSLAWKRYLERLIEAELIFLADFPEFMDWTSMKSSYLYEPAATKASSQIGFGNTLTKVVTNRLSGDVITTETLSLIS